MALYLHIGLPKTATTYWQKSVFSRIDGVIYSSSAHGSKDISSPTIMLKRFFTGSASHNDAALQETVKRIQNLGQLDQSDILISQENCSVAPNGFWQGKGPDPKEFCQRMAKLKDALGNPQIRIMFGTRQVDEWLVSRYAQSARSMENPCQADFDKHIKRICAPNGMTGPNLWLKFDYVERILNDAVGSENVCIMPMENLQLQAKQEILRIGRFIGNRDLTLLLQEMQSDGSLITKQNVRKTEDGVWKLNGSNQSITLFDTQREDINSAISAHIAR